MPRVGIAGAVEGEHDLVAVVDRAELGRGGEDVQEMRELVGGERIDLGASDRGLDASVQVCLDLGCRHLRKGAVAEACRYAMRHGPPGPRAAGVCYLVT